SVTYGPKRPSLTTIGLPLAGSSPSSLSGGAAARRRRVLGAASRVRASSRVAVKSCSSDSSERVSEPFFTYGPLRPLAAATPLAGRPRERQQAQRLVEGDRVRAHRGEERGRPRLVLPFDRLADVGPVTPGAHEHPVPGLRVDAELALLPALGKQLLGALGRQL